MRKAVGRIWRAISNSRLVLRLEELSATSMVQVQQKGDALSGARNGTHVLLAAPGNGNIGDQAMFEAFVRSVDGHVLVVVRAASDLLAIPSTRAADVEVMVLPDLLYGTTIPHLRDFRRLLKRLDDSRSLSVIGADIMDGAYNDRASIRRFRIPRLVSRLGLDTRILGFSWNDHPTPRARSAMIAASSVTTLLPREPRTAERLTIDGALDVTTVADLAFLVTPSGRLAPDLNEWIEQQRADARQIVIVNANHGLQRYTDQVDALVTVIQKGLERQSSFVLLPHDSRGKESDEVLARKIWDAVGQHPRVFLIPRVIMPADVATLAGRADFAITGRMHLAILASTVGTPAIALSYQGKIEGLYRKLGLSSFIEPDSDLGANVWRQYLLVSENLATNRATLQANVGELKELARGNVRGLESEGVAGTIRAAR